MTTSQFDIQEYVRPLLRWWWLVVVAVVLAMLSSFFYTKLQPDVYMARSTIAVGMDLRNPNPDGGRIYLAQQLAGTYADIANREPLREATKKALGLDWLPYYLVTQLGEKPMIEVQVYAEDSQVAFVVAQELVNQIVLQGPKEEQARSEFMNQQLAKLQASITQTEEDITKSENELLTINSARELANKQVEIRALQDKLATLRENYANLLATTQEGAVNALSLLEPPTIPESPVDSGLLLNMLVAAVVGLALAGAGAYTLEYLDDSLKSGEDLKKLSSASLLGAVPYIEQSEGGLPNRLIGLQNAQSSALEAYRRIRTNLQFAAIDSPLDVIVVSSPEPEDGKSLTAANLSIILARAGKRVVLVDADLHRPTQHRLFGIYNNMGVTTALLVEKVDLTQLLQSTSVPGLSILASGPLPPNPAELLGSRRMQDLLTKLKELADIVVVDTPPITAVVDALILTGQAAGIVLVARANKTSRDAVRRAANSLQQVRAHLFGTVLNGVKVTNQDYYYKKYGYYNASHGSAAAQGTKEISTAQRAPIAVPATVQAPTLEGDYPHAPVSPPQASEETDNVTHKVEPPPLPPVEYGLLSTAIEDSLAVIPNGESHAHKYNGSNGHSSNSNGSNESRSNGALRNSLLTRRRTTPPSS